MSSAQALRVPGELMALLASIEASHSPWLNPRSTLLVAAWVGAQVPSRDPSKVSAVYAQVRAAQAAGDGRKKRKR